MQPEVQLNTRKLVNIEKIMKGKMSWVCIIVLMMIDILAWLSIVGDTPYSNDFSVISNFCGITPLQRTVNLIISFYFKLQDG